MVSMDRTATPVLLSVQEKIFLHHTAQRRGEKGGLCVRRHLLV